MNSTERHFRYAVSVCSMLIVADSCSSRNMLCEFENAVVLRQANYHLSIAFFHSICNIYFFCYVLFHVYTFSMEKRTETPSCLQPLKIACFWKFDVDVLLKVVLWFSALFITDIDGFSKFFRNWLWTQNMKLSLLFHCGSLDCQFSMRTQARCLPQNHFLYQHGWQCIICHQPLLSAQTWQPDLIINMKWFNSEKIKFSSRKTISPLKLLYKLQIVPPERSPLTLQWCW